MFFSLVAFTSKNKDQLLPLPSSGGGASPMGGTSVVKLINTVAKAFDARYVGIVL